MQPYSALILAAGDGGRLQPLTNEMPKPLLKLAGRALIHHVLDALYAGGVRDATIVVGYEGAQMRYALGNPRPCGMDVRFVENDGWELGNARSIWSAREAMAGHDGFVLAMADHIIEPAMVRAVVLGAGARTRLAVEFAETSDRRADEATRALVDGDRVLDLGKNIETWNALDTGVFWGTRRVFDVMAAGDDALRDGEAGAVFAGLARAGELDAVDVTGACWIDIDTEADLHAAAVMPVALAAATLP